MQTFRLGQFVKPNITLRTSWFEGYADQAGAFYPLLHEDAESTTTCINWETEGMVIKLLEEGALVVSFPQGLVLAKNEWITSSDR